MGREVLVGSRSAVDFKKTIGVNLGDSGALERLEALAGMDPDSAGIVTGAVVSAAAVFPKCSPEPYRTWREKRALMPIIMLNGLSFQLSFDI